MNKDNDIQVIQKLRQSTGAGIMDCKKAIKDSGGDLEKAMKLLREKGIARAQKRSGRSTSQGLVLSYIHPGNQLGVLLELNCETDFVARTPEFGQLGRELAMQVAACSPAWICREDVPDEAKKNEKEIYMKQAQTSGKPEKVWEKIAEGRMEKYFSETCLLEQPYIKDQEINVQELITRTIAKIGENIKVARFSRFKLGEE